MLAKHHLLNFADVFSKRRFKGSAVRGLRAIPVSRIVGSVNRSHDYYFDFTKISEGDRTREIERMMARGDSLPPIDVFQVGEYYYVEDGHHRVAIAKKLKQEFIDAYVTQYFFWSYEEYFHQKLGFPDICCSRPLQYKKLLDDIRNLRQEKYDEHYVDFQEVADIWYAHVYKPAIEKIESSGIRARYGDSPADIYCNYLTLRGLQKFKSTSFDDILAFMVRKYSSPFRFVERAYASVVKIVARLTKRLLGLQHPDDIHPTA